MQNFIYSKFKIIRMTPQETEQELKNIRKRVDGRWEGRKTINGKRFSVFARTQKECIKKLKNLKIENSTQKNQDIPKNLMNFAFFWLDNYKKSKITKESYRNYKSIITNFLNYDWPLKNITNFDLQNILNKMPATRNKEYCYMTIKQIFKKALELEVIKKDPSIFLEKGKIERGERKALNLQEQKILFNSLSNDVFSTAILTYLLLGCRPAELKRLTITEESGNYVYIDGTKTKKAKRWVKVSNAFKKRLLEHNQELKNINIDNFARKFKLYCSDLGINANVYVLRHTYATNLFYLGVKDKERQVFMGHSSSVLTNDIYTTYDPNITKNDILNLYKDLYPEF